jgi:hypothetical protein
MVDSEGGLLGSDRIRIQNGHAKNYIPTVKKKKKTMYLVAVSVPAEDKSRTTLYAAK